MTMMIRARRYLLVAGAFGLLLAPLCLTVRTRAVVAFRQPPKAAPATVASAGGDTGVGVPSQE
jgi:hypothetical protein